jgi:hypothetical protein
MPGPLTGKSIDKPLVSDRLQAWHLTLREERVY